MNSLWLNLFWKEWREHQWKLLTLCCVVFALVLATKPDHLREWGETAVVLAWILSAPIGLFIGAGVAAGENNRGTIAFTQSQPVGLWRVGLAKLTVGATVAVLPCVLAVLFFGGLDRWGGLLTDELADGLRWNTSMGTGGIESPVTFFLSISVITSLSTYLWSATIGVNSRDEVRAAVWGLGLMGAWAISVVALQALGEMWVPRSASAEVAIVTFTSFGPLGTFSAFNDIAVSVPLLRVVWLVISCVAHLGLAIVFVWRFGRPLISGLDAGQPSRAPMLPVRDFLAPPLRSRFAALTWKELRECGAVVAAGVAGCLLFGVTVLVFALTNGEDLTTAENLRELAVLFVAPAVYVGPLVAVIVGLGVTLRDLSPALNTFWRSRPISADRAFWIPVTTGVATLAICFVVPALLVVWWVQNSPWTLRNEVTVGWVGTGACALLLFFATGACFAAATRNAIYAAILSLGVSLTAVFWTGELYDGRRWIAELWQMDLIFLTLAAAALVTAWVLYRTDWPIREWRQPRAPRSDAG